MSFIDISLHSNIGVSCIAQMQTSVSQFCEINIRKQNACFRTKYVVRDLYIHQFIVSNGIEHAYLYVSSIHLSNRKVI